MSQKTPVVIASVLKPVNDPRMLFKLAYSLRETNKYDLNIIGFSSKKTPNHENIRFHSVFSKSRKHFTRIMVSFRMLKVLFRTRPRLIIVTTYELLPAAVLGKLLLGYRLVYDVQENYGKNVIYNNTLPKPLRKPAALFIRVCEKTAGPFVDHYLFAEKCYVQEFPQVKNYTVIENKSTWHSDSSVPVRLNPHAHIRFLISGTITEAYGVKKALQWFLSLLGDYPNIRLHIVGHAPVPSFRNQVEALARSHQQISLNLSSVPIPHEVLRKCMQKADVMVLPYLLLPSIRDKVPTKLYEALALGRPILISKNPIWEKMICSGPAGLGVDFSATGKAKDVMGNFLSKVFYKTQPESPVLWKHEKVKFIELVDRILLP
ncbi:glycosyltransferase [Negadavirga shengliensis]|uniref:Glycosyltransferase n=1 Tax=Negadavirga shengliensis TaxID=1389218 RepID=A0ABV9T0F2_9BACT